MNTNNTIFKFDDAKKYFEKYISLDSCIDDNECPENSYCIGKKCIITFYCKKEDKLNCTLYEDEICNEEKERVETCNKDDDCFLAHCSKDGHCAETTYICDKYVLGHFTFEDGKNYFDNLNNSCNTDEDCPNYNTCEEHSCKSRFYCNENNSTCSFSSIIKDGISQLDEHKCNSNDDCISNNCKENYCEKLYFFDNEGYGLTNGNKCYNDWECASNHCAITSSFTYACGEESLSTILIFLSVLFLIFCAVVAIFVWISNRIKNYYNMKDYREDEIAYETEMKLINKDQEKQD